MFATVNGYSLNTQQQEAFSQMRDFLFGSDNFFCLKGYAGTGKTYLVIRFISWIIENNPTFKIALSAPTNNAVTVLQGAASDFGLNTDSVSLEFLTIYRLLGLKVVESDSDAERIIKDKYGEDSLSQFDVIVVDESSMISCELFNKIYASSKRSSCAGIKWIFMGDPAQLKPVGEEVSPTMKITRGYELTQIVRQSDSNPISQLVGLSRNMVVNPETTSWNPQSELLYDKSGGVWVFENRRLWVKHAIASFKVNDDPYFSRIITWRNRTADNLNLQIRESLVDSLDSFVPGEILIAKEAVSDPNDGTVIRITTASVVEVIMSRCEEFNTKHIDVRIPERIFPAWSLKVQDDEGLRHRITVIDPKSRNDFEAFTKEFAYHIRSNVTSDLGRYWKAYWTLVRSAANLSYKYASTVRRCQGITLSNVFPDLVDLSANRNTDEKWRGIYVALSRCKDRLIISI
jgi:exodeoxyribonuclease-5